MRKGLPMAVNTVVSRQFAGWATALAVGMASQGAVANEAVLRMLARDVTVKTALLGVAEQECTAREKAALPAALSDGTLRALGLPRKDLVLAVGYLAQRNRYACSQRALADLLHATTVLERAQKDYGQPASAIQGNLAELVQPSPRYFEMAVAYSQLAPEARTQLEDALGTAPFDLSAALPLLPRE